MNKLKCPECGSKKIQFNRIVKKHMEFDENICGECYYIWYENMISTLNKYRKEKK